MQSIKNIKDKINNLSKETEKFKVFWIKIAEVFERRCEEYKFSDNDEVPDELLLDVFDHYAEEFKAVSYDMPLETVHERLVQYLYLFNKGELTQYNISTEQACIDKKTFFMLNSEDNAKELAETLRSFKIKEGLPFFKLLLSYKINNVLNKKETFTRERMKKAWIFFKTYSFRVIPDYGLILTDDVLDALKLYINLNLPKKEFDTEKISEVKHYVGIFNSLFCTKIKLIDVGLTYEQLRQTFSSKDQWIRSEEDEKYLKELRSVTHYYLDSLWNGKAEEYGIKMKRSEVYSWLARSLNLTKDKCHVAIFNEVQCVKTLLEVFHLLGRK